LSPGLCRLNSDQVLGRMEINSSDFGSVGEFWRGAEGNGLDHVGKVRQ
jgi:hypothetical protein